MNAKSPAILLALIAVLGGVVLYLFFSGPSGGDEGGLGGSGTEALAAEGPGRTTDIDSASEADERAARTERPPALVGEREVVKSKSKQQNTAPKPEAPKTGPWLKGFVRDVNGYGIADAEVEVRSEGGAATLLNFAGSPFIETATTGPDGSFKVTRNGLLGSDLRVKVEAYGYLVERIETTPSTEKGDADLGEIIVEPGVVIAGLVVDADGDPVEGALVNADKAGNGRNFRWGNQQRGEKTDAEGRFELAHQTPGIYDVRASHENFPNADIEVDVSTVGLHNTGVYVQFPRSVSIEGRLLGMPSDAQYVQVFALPTEYGTARETLGPGEMMQQFSGRSDGATSDVDANGRFALHGLLANQNYELMATIPGSMMQRVRCSDHLVTQGGVDDVELKWDRGATIQIDLVNADTQQPVKRSSINYRWNSDDFAGFQFGSTQRDFATSKIELTELRPSESVGRLDLMITAPGMLSKQLEDVEVVQDEVTDLGKVELEPAPMVRVFVRDKSTGEPIRRARISLIPVLPGEDDMEEWERRFGEMRPDTKKGKTEKDGWAEVENCGTEEARLRVQASGYGDHEEVVSLSSDSQLELRIDLEEGADIRITVADRLGEPINDARVDFEAPGDVEGNGSTNSRGLLRLRDSRPGEYRVRARRSRGAWGGWSEWTTFFAAAGDKVEVTVALPVAADVTGVVSVDGKPGRGVEVSFVELDENGQGSPSWADSHNDETNAKGEFQLEDVAVGTHELHVTINEAAGPHVVPITVAEGQNRIEFELTTARLTGLVVDTNGSPIAGAEINTWIDEPMGATRAVEVGVTIDVGGGGTRMLRSDGEVRTDKNGRFEILGLPMDRSVQVSARRTGYVDATLRIPAAELQREARLVMTSAGSLVVTVTGDTGGGWSAVVAKNVETGEEESEWGQGGKRVFESLEPGKYKVFTRTWSEDGMQDGEENAVEVDIAVGQRAAVTLAN